MGGFRLKKLNAGFRLGLTGVLACLSVGQVAGLWHMRTHFDKRDDVPGFTRDDIVSAYRGLEAPSPLLSRLNAGHPDTLKAEERRVLVAWLTSGKIEQDYDNPDLGVASPKEIVASSCLRCHSAKSAEGVAHPLKLDSAAEIKKVAFGRRVLPTPPEKVVVSIHAHASSMGLMALAVICLAAFSRWPRGLTGLLSAACGVGLACEFAGMWFMRGNEPMLNLLLGGGTAFHGFFALLTLMVFLDLWFPGGGGKCGDGCTCKREARS